MTDIAAAEKPKGFYSLHSHGRTLCDVLEEMRECSKTLHFGAMAGLIEEAQSIGNRMEDGLDRRKNISLALEYSSHLKKEIEQLEARRDSLRKEQADA